MVPDSAIVDRPERDEWRDGGRVDGGGAARAERPKPGLDDKVLTEWNGLMLATIAEAAAAFGRSDWLAAAVANGEFQPVAENTTPEGRAKNRRIAIVVLPEVFTSPEAPNESQSPPPDEMQTRTSD